MTKDTPPASTSMVSTGDAELQNEVRGSGPALLLFGCPMNGAAFAPLGSELATDHTVITPDPRDINLSRVTDSDRDVSPEELAADPVQILDHFDIGAASVFGSSGGAVRRSARRVRAAIVIGWRTSACLHQRGHRHRSSGRQ